MKDTLIGLLTALRFLTVLPIFWHAESDHKYYKQSVIFFPIVGLLIGTCGYLLANLLTTFFPLQISSCLLLFYLSSISGFLHLDGLADTADGLLSYRPREKKLAIMRDSRSGAMGVIILVFMLLLKFSAVNSIQPSYLPLAFFYMPIASRCAIVLTMVFLPYARSEGGLGQLFYLGEKYQLHFLVMVFLLVLCFIVDFNLTLIALLALIATVVLFGLWCKKVLGGTTGDTLGAVCELTETTVVVFLAAALNL